MTDHRVAKSTTVPPALLETKWRRVAEHDADTARLLSELKTDMGRAAWLREGKRRFGWTESEMDRRSDPAKVQRHREQARSRAAATRKLSGSDEPSDDDLRRVRDMVRQIIIAGHRALAMKYHPDVASGSLTAMTDLNAARDKLMRLFWNM